LGFSDDFFQISIEHAFTTRPASVRVELFGPRISTAHRETPHISLFSINYTLYLAEGFKVFRIDRAEHLHLLASGASRSGGNFRDEKRRRPYLIKLTMNAVKLTLNLAEDFGFLV